MLLLKLPGGTRDKWSKKVFGIRGKLKRDPELVDLIDFVSDANLIVTDPVSSKVTVDHCIEKKQVKCGKKLSTYVAGSTKCHVSDHVYWYSLNGQLPLIFGKEFKRAN